MRSSVETVPPSKSTSGSGGGSSALFFSDAMDPEEVRCTSLESSFNRKRIESQLKEMKKLKEKDRQVSLGRTASDPTLIERISKFVKPSLNGSKSGPTKKEKLSDGRCSSPLFLVQQMATSVDNLVFLGTRNDHSADSNDNSKNGLFFGKDGYSTESSSTSSNTPHLTPVVDSSENLQNQKSDEELNEGSPSIPRRRQPRLPDYEVAEPYCHDLDKVDGLAVLKDNGDNSEEGIRTPPIPKRRQNRLPDYEEPMPFVKDLADDVPFDESEEETVNDEEEEPTYYNLLLLRKQTMHQTNKMLMNVDASNILEEEAKKLTMRFGDATDSDSSSDRS